MKRIIALVLTVILSIGFFSGCKGDNERILYNKTKFSKYVKLCDYKGIEVDTSSKEFAKYYEEEIDTDINDNALYIRENEGVILHDHVINIDYKSIVDGKEHSGISKKNSFIQIGANSFLEGFDDGLVGSKVGDTVELDLKFPEAYIEDDLSGKDVKFIVKINYILTDMERQPEEYYSELGFKSFNEYDKDLKLRATRDYLFDKVIDNSKIKEYPQKEKEYLLDLSIKTITDSIKEKYNISLKEYISSLGKTYDEYKESLIKDEIEPMLDYQLIMYYIFDKENMSITSEEIDKRIKNTVENYGHENVDENYFITYYGRHHFESLIVCEKVLDLLQSNAKIK